MMNRKKHIYVLPSGEQNSWKLSRSIVLNSLSSLGLSKRGESDLKEKT